MNQQFEDFIKKLVDTIGEKEAIEFATIANKAMTKSPILFRASMLGAKQKLKKLG